MRSVIALSVRAITIGFRFRRHQFEQRIALGFLLDETVQFDMGELQQPDRLHQLRRHDQRLALSQLKTG
jgi:hypothetical protein